MHYEGNRGMIENDNSIYRISFLDKCGREIKSTDIQALNGFIAREASRGLAVKIKGCVKVSSMLIGKVVAPWII